MDNRLVKAARVISHGKTGTLDTAMAYVGSQEIWQLRSVQGSQRRKTPLGYLMRTNGGDGNYASRYDAKDRHDVSLAVRVMEAFH